MNRVQTPRGRFRVERSGNPARPPLVLVSGLADDHTSWGGVLPQLERDYHCISFDNRGIGHSPISEGPYTITGLAQDAQAIVAALGLERVTAIGSSMGGAICQEWALAEPATVTRLVLSNTYARCDPWLDLVLDHWIGLARRRAESDILQLLRYFCFSPDYVAANPEVIRGFMDAPVPDLDGFVAQAQACRGHDAETRLARLEVPTLLIGGSEDILTRPEMTRRIAAGMPRAQVEWLKTGHMTFWEQPEAWAQRVLTFLGATGPA